MLKRISILFLGVAPFLALAQKTYSTKSASVKFFSHTVAEDVEAVNKQVLCSLNDKTGQTSFAVLIKGFKFENSLMQQHFNDKDYMFSDKFPKSTFAGNITNIASVNFAKNGSYPVTAEGSLTMHGITQKIKQTGTITIANGKVSLKSIFKIKPKTYGIAVPDGIADEIEVTVTTTF
jgi:polyisoprenoid-binding protein YceI